ncbi:MAG: ABC transporter permease [Clostridiales bacterium]|nr:ABC transporter permease [Clostridiales bacterium]
MNNLADVTIAADQADAEARRAEKLRLLMRKKPKYIAEVWRVFWKNKLAVVSLAVVLFILLAALCAPLIVPYSEAIRQDVLAKFTPPGAGHPFGTDNLGRDVFSRILHGGRVSMTMGVIPTFASLLLGIVFGGAAVYCGGRVDSVVMRLCDMLSCIPGVLLALTFVAALGPGLENVLIAVTIASVPDLTRYVRSVILNIVGLEYIDAARSCGAGGARIVARHVIPNAAGPLILSAVSNIASMIMIGAGLSYLGLGIQPPNPEWGNMLAEGQNYFTRAPYLMFAPGVVILVAVLAFNLVGDGLRDALDPKLR